MRLVLSIILFGITNQMCLRARTPTGHLQKELTKTFEEGSSCVSSYFESTSFDQNIRMNRPIFINLSLQAPMLAQEITIVRALSFLS